MYSYPPGNSASAFRPLGYGPSKHGIHYERWGEWIYDPEVFSYSWPDLRSSDPTLPKHDPRDMYWPGRLRHPTDGARYWELAPYVKWLYFSNEHGSYAKRLELFNSATDTQERIKLEQRLNPGLLPDDVLATFNQQRNVGNGVLYKSTWTRNDEEATSPKSILVAFAVLLIIGAIINIVWILLQRGH